MKSQLWIYTLAVLLMIIMGSTASCSQNPSEESSLPSYPVNINLNIQTQAHQLTAPYTSFIIIEPNSTDEFIGISGVIIVHGVGSSTNDTEYYAYDRCCPVESERQTAIQSYSHENKDKGLILYQCPKCQTIYELGMGTGHPISLPGNKPLKRYHITKQGYLLHITN